VIRLILGILCVFVLAFSAEKYDLNEDILKIKKELSSVDGQRGEVKKEYKQDQADYEEYKKQFAEKKARFQAEIDSIRLLIKNAQAEQDSLLSETGSIKAGIEQQELLQKRFRQTILEKAKLLAVKFSKLPPLAVSQVRGSLDYLISEITAQTVDNTEAFHRLMQIVYDCRELSSEIDIAEEVSPVKGLAGIVHRFRVGTLFEAVVDTKGEHAFVWGDNGEWYQCDSLAGAILEAVWVRGGKKVPVMVDIPFTVKGVEVDNDK
ncbi:MAG: DUF3450 family protein, partial [Fibrobacter sp.]|nr:DUF3450 family protein [Fibrobacter sp.]